MSGLSDASELDLWKLILNNTTWAGMGDTTGIVGSGTAGSFFVALHTSDPTDAGTQTSNEATYTGYARVAVARSSSGFTCSTTSGVTTAVNASAVNFPACTAGSNTITHFSVGKASTGTGEILFVGPLSASLAVSTGITPNFATGQLSGAID